MKKLRMMKNGDSKKIKELNDFNVNDIFVLPYIRHYTKELELILKKKCNLRVLYNYSFELDGMVKKAKYKIGKLDNKSVAYNTLYISCNDCDKC